MSQTYRVQWRYAGTLYLAGGNQQIVFAEGDTVQLDDDVAEAVNRDSPGVLTRHMKKAPEHRMMTAEKTETRQLSQYEVTDAAAKLAAANDLDLSEIKGSGKDGKILKSDVEALID
jgi:pyruvate/2-oxoglutarate dehydrogenase complex dihydrolipoamide acyltransferase (E2) component